MTISEQIDALQAKVAELKSSLEASRHETNEQIKARVATARAKAEAAQQTVHGNADEAADHAHTQWQSFKADNSAKMQELHGRIERKRDERDVKAAEREPRRPRTTRPTRWTTRPGPSTWQRRRCSMPPMPAPGPTRGRQRRRPAEHARRPGTTPPR